MLRVSSSATDTGDVLAPVESWEADTVPSAVAAVSSRKLKITYGARLFVIELVTAAEAEAAVRALAGAGVTVKPAHAAVGASSLETSQAAMMDIPVSQVTAAYEDHEPPSTPADVQRAAMAELAALPPQPRTALPVLLPPSPPRLPPHVALPVASIVSTPQPSLLLAPTTTDDFASFAEMVAAAVAVRLRAADGGGIGGGGGVSSIPPPRTMHYRDVATETAPSLAGSENLVADQLITSLEGPTPYRDALLDALFSSGSSLRRLAAAISNAL